MLRDGCARHGGAQGETVSNTRGAAQLSVRRPGGEQNILIGQRRDALQDPGRTLWGSAEDLLLSFMGCMGLRPRLSVGDDSHCENVHVH